MTIGIGFVGIDNHICLASDSQMTWPGYKQTGYEKIVRVKFTKDHYAALVKAGDWEWANFFHEALLETAAVTDVVNETTIRGTCEAVLKTVRHKILDAYNHPSFPPGSAAEWLKSRPCEFLVAYVYGEKTYFYTMDLVGAVPSRVFHKFAAIGSGAELASYILNNAETSQLIPDACYATAMFAIEACIEHSAGCGGPVQSYIINKLGRWTIASETYSEQFRAAVRRVNAEHFKTLPAHYNPVTAFYASCM